MKPAFSLLIVSLFTTTLVACSGAERDSGSNAQESEGAPLSSAHWKKIYQCDDGTTLDVNVDERQEIQLVVRGQEAVEYLTTGLPDPYGGMVRPNTRGELVFQGGVYNYDKPGANPPPQGIFYPWDFTLGSGTAGNLPARIVREREHEIRIFLDIPHEDRPFEEVQMPTDWIFRNCY